VTVKSPPRLQCDPKIRWAALNGGVSNVGLEHDIEHTADHILVVGGFAFSMLRTATEERIKGVVKAEIRAIDWPAELGRVLQKSRGVERQELRFKSYGALWKELRPLAIYDVTDINKKTVERLSSKLSNWFFSECGSLLLTPQARGFYFALQELLRKTSKQPKWRAIRSGGEGQQNPILREVLTNRSTEKANEAIKVLDYFEAGAETGAFEDWGVKGSKLGQNWRKGIEEVAAVWNKLDEGQRFATLQQVGAILRASLTTDLESRVR
jgi:hypothetical protein